MENTIKEIGGSYLCTGCGTCAGICPTNAIEMRKDAEGVYRPFVNKDKCNECSLCVKVCPGRLVDFNELNTFVFGRIRHDDSLGNYVGCYIGYSLDDWIRWNASSGGIVTTLLIFALEEGMIDGALVIRMSKHHPLEPEAIIARTNKEIITALGSKYCPVPANVAIKEILERKGKYAVVGLPCHIHGIRKAEMLNKELKERIILHIGLFCSHLVNFLGTELLLERMNIRKEDVTRLSYRGKGWPGKLSIRLRNGCEKSIDLTDYWDCMFGPFFFTPLRCTLCADTANELSDISVGDPWLPELKDKNQIGMSIIVTRTETGEKILHLAKSKGKVKVTSINHAKVEQSLKFNLNFKRKTLATRISFMRMLGKDVPDMHPRSSAPRFTSYLNAVLPYFSICVSSKKRLRFLLKYVPFPLLRTYFRVFYALLVFT